MSSSPFQKLTAILIVAVYRALSFSWRIRHVRRPVWLGTKPVVHGHLHGDELLLVAPFSRAGLAVMVSRSKDGQMMKTVLEIFGYTVVRGSSSKGGAGGLKGLIDKVKEGASADLAVDGPRGPVYQVKPGIIKLAQETGAPLVLGAASANHRFIFKKAWNRCYLPLPFATCVIVYGEPLSIPQNLSDVEFEQKRQEVEDQLIRLKAEAESTFGRSFSRT